MQARTFALIRELTADGVAPSYDELRAHLGLASNGGVLRLVHALSERGLVTYLPRRARSVRIVGEIEGLERRSTEELLALQARIADILVGRAS